VRELGLPAAIVVRESYDPALDAVVDAHRRARGITVIHRGAAGAAFRIVRALRSGLPVGFLPDLGGRVPSVALPFLGRPFPFPIGPQEIAVRAKAPVLVGTLQRARERRGGAAAAPPFELVIERLEPAATRDELSRRVAAHIEARITRAGSESDYPWMAPRREADCGAAGDKSSLVGYLPENGQGTR
jgi:lauroyl/myristoyl acyltransferase